MAVADLVVQIGLIYDSLKRDLDAAISAVESRIMATWTNAAQAGLSPVRAIRLVRQELVAMQGVRFRAFADTLDSTYNAAVQRGWTAGVVDAVVQAGGSKAKLGWQTMSAGPCPDCEGRNGRIEEAGTWFLIGTPGTVWPGGTAPVCSLQVRRCKCALVPVPALTGRILARAPDESRPGRTRAA